MSEDPLILNVFLLVAAFAVNMFTQILVYRYPPRLSLLLSILIGFITGGLFLLVMTTALTDISFALLGVNSLLYASGGYCYFQLINIGEASIRLRVLAELTRLPDGLTEAQILKEYDSSSIVNARIGRLVSSGQINIVAGRYVEGTPKLLYLAYLFRALKWFVLGYVKPITLPTSDQSQ